MDHAHATDRSTDRGDHRSDARSTECGGECQVTAAAVSEVKDQSGRKVGQSVGGEQRARAGILKFKGMLTCYFPRPRLK